jgi:hypothetical protein
MRVERLPTRSFTQGFNYRVDLLSIARAGAKRSVIARDLFSPRAASLLADP